MAEGSIEQEKAQGTLCYRASGFSRWHSIAILGLITAIGLSVFVSAATSGDGAGLLFLAVCLPVLCWSWYTQLARVFFEVTLWPSSGQLRFRSVLRQTVTSIDALSRITSTTNRITVVFHSRDGKLQVLRNLDGMSDLVHRIRQANPALTTRGL